MAENLAERVLKLAAAHTESGPYAKLQETEEPYFCPKKKDNWVKKCLLSKKVQNIAKDTCQKLERKGFKSELYGKLLETEEPHFCQKKKNGSLQKVQNIGKNIQKLERKADSKSEPNSELQETEPNQKKKNCSKDCSPSKKVQNTVKNTNSTSILDEPCCNFCKNRLFGCKIGFLKNRKNLENHHEKCQFRQVYCVVDEKCGLVTFNHIETHINLYHTSRITTSENNRQFDLVINNFLSERKSDIFWEIEFSGRKFYLTTGYINNSIRIWVYLHGSLEESENFAFDISLKSDIFNSSFQACVYPVDFERSEILKNQPTFMISNGVNRQFIQNEELRKNAILKVSIQNLREKAKSESRIRLEQEIFLENFDLKNKK